MTEDDNELIMYAENLGSIPPNTALMIVTVGDKRYEVNISSTEQTNGAVRFRYKSQK
jgi:type IV secretory pathway VirB9-like protein